MSKPYYEKDGITIYHGDCLEVMQDFEDKSFDLVLTDPPYGDGIGYGRFGKQIENNEDESINYAVLPEIARVLREDSVCYLFTNWRFSPQITAFLGEWGGFSIRTMLVIVKNNIGMGHGFRNQHEFCFVLEKGKPKYNGNDMSNVQFMRHINHDKNTHPHEKDTYMLQRFLEHASAESDTTLDPFMGSGSTLVAAYQLGRKAVGIEISEKYCEIAAKRLETATIPMFS